MAPSKILAIKLRSLGDTVLMTAPLIELTRAFPQARIDVVATQEWAPLLEGIPGINQILPIQRSHVIRFALHAWRKKYDCVVNFHASSSSSFLSLATGAKLRSIHFHGHQDRNRYSTVTIPGKGTLKPIIERDMDSLRALGLHIPAGRSPHLYLQPAEIREASTFYDKLRLSEPRLILGLGASRPTKSWPIERFASLAIEWVQKERGSVLAIASSNEDFKITSFLKLIDDHLFASLSRSEDRSRIREKIAAVSHLKIRQLAAVIQQASVFAGNDSGPKHIAVAVDTPTVTLFGPEDPFEWHPYPKERHPYLFIDPLPCRRDADPGMPPWCGLQNCIIEEHKCMRQIGVDSVLAQCQRVVK